MLDEIAVDAAKEYNVRLSKWKQGAFSAIMCPIFWYLLYMCRVVRGPLRHFMAYVQKHSSKGDCLFNLVTGKLDEFAAEYTKLFQNFSQITETAINLAGCAQFNPDDLAGLKLVAHKLICQQWAAFHRRIYKPLQQSLGACWCGFANYWGLFF